MLFRSIESLNREAKRIAKKIPVTKAPPQNGPPTIEVGVYGQDQMTLVLPTREGNIVAVAMNQSGVIVECSCSQGLFSLTNPQFDVLVAMRAIQLAKKAAGGAL